MDALSPASQVQRVVLMKSAQVGATEAGNNWIDFCMHRAPGPFLAVQPTVDPANRLSQQRIEPLIEERPDLRARHPVISGWLDHPQAMVSTCADTSSV